MDHSVPIIDIAALVSQSGNQRAVSEAIGQACREFGFFYIVGHGIDEGLQRRLEEVSRQFFAQELEMKREIRMELGGRAWRGYFPVGNELTSGKPDLKEGLYFGAALNERDPRVQAGLPMHGANLFPKNIPAFRETVLDYMTALTDLGHTLMQGLSMSLGLDPSYFADHYTGDPLTLFRIFHYPPAAASDDAAQWGVGEHTDYGVLTILKQDNTGGLQVKTKTRWIEAPPVPNSFVCNIGDMLERITRGLYRSTPHRVRNVSSHGRLSFPFFFDPNFDTPVRPVDLSQAPRLATGESERWDDADVHAFEGTYGEYILGKVAKVFPELRRSVL